MAIKLSDSIRVGQQKPLEDKYFNELVPYTSTSQVNTLLPKAVRHIGLTVNINKEEYWYKDGIEDSNLVLKITNNDIYDLKNQEQDDKLENLEGGLANKLDKGTYIGTAQSLKNDIDSKANISHTHDISSINNLQTLLDTINNDINNLEGINYTWSPTNRTLTLFDSNGTQLSQVSLVSLDNEGTDFRYNASTLSLELWNADNELLDSIPVSSFVVAVGTQLQLNSNKLQLKDSQGNILSTVSFTVSNIQGLQAALVGKQDVLTEDNLGQFMDLELTTKSTPTSGDTVLAMDSVTGKAVRIPTDQLGGGGSIDISGKLDKGTYTGTAQDLKNNIDNIQIGGRNLLLNSKNFAGLTNWGINGSAVVTQNTDYITLDLPANIHSSGLFQIINLGGYTGDITISFDAKAGNSGWNADLNIGIEGKVVKNGFGINDMLTWTRFSFTLNLGTVTNACAFIFYKGNNDNPLGIHLRNIKLEKGNKATDWTPAPEDKQDRLQDVTENIGVGKTDSSATEKLDVNGYVKATGFKVTNGTPTQALTANGEVFDLTTKADLVSGKIPANQLPSYVDDVLEFANLASFPATGESGKIYIAIDTNLTYRWGGSSYVVMSSSLALGETSSTAYRGDRGKTAYDHSQTTGNPHGTKLEELSDVSGTDTTIIDTDIILKKETGGFWKKITFANFKSWFTTALAKKINIGLDTIFNFKNISAMTLKDFRSINPDVETIYFTEEQNATGWQQVRFNSKFSESYSGLFEVPIIINTEAILELDSDSTFNLIDVANTKINGIFEKDFVIITFSGEVWTQKTATANQWVKLILKINGVQAAVAPVFYLTEPAGTPERISHSFALNVTAEMVTYGATLHLKSSTFVTLYKSSLTVARVHKSTNANR